MKRREFCKSIALVPATGALASFPSLAKAVAAGEATSGGSSPASGEKSAAGSKRKMPDWAGKLGYSDMTSYDDDGKPNAGFSDRSSKPKSDDPTAPYQMPLKDVEQANLNGGKGPELAKVMKIVVDHGNAFNAGI